MLNRTSSAAYQAAAMSGATQMQLLQLVYGRVAQDLLQAAEAVRCGKIAERCQASEHALLLLGHVESWVDQMDDPSLAEGLRQFYRMLRARVLQLQASPSPEAFVELSHYVLDALGAWRTKENELLRRGSASPEYVTAPRERFSFRA